MNTVAAAKPKYSTPRCKLSFPTLFQPKQIMGEGELKYEVTALFEPGADLQQLQRAVIDCMVAKWGDKAIAEARANKIALPFRDQGEKDHLQGYISGAKFFAARSKLKPFICDHQLRPITDPDEAYPGRNAKLAVNVFAWTHPKGGRGVSFGLLGVQLLEHGERFGQGGTKPSDVFEAVEIEGAANDNDEPGEEAARSLFG